MNERRFNDWLASLPALTSAQKQRLETALSGSDPATSVARELDALSVSECPHCAAGAPVRCGHANGLHRYQCHACRRTFNVLTGTPLARLRHRAAWRVFAQALIDGETVRQPARRTGVHRNTAFRWRHRFLAAPAAMQAQRLAGIAEADETVMRRSYKGARSLKRPPRKRGGGARKTKRGRNPDEEVGVLVIRDREGHTLSGALDTVDSQTIDDTVGHRLDREAVLCTDGAPVYQRYARHRGVVHEPINLAQGIRVRRRAFHGTPLNRSTGSSGSSCPVGSSIYVNTSGSHGMIRIYTTPCALTIELNNRPRSAITWHLPAKRVSGMLSMMLDERWYRPNEPWGN